MAVITVSAGNVLILRTEARSNFKILNVTSSLTLRARQSESPTARSVTDALALGQAARMTYGVLSVSLASTLALTQYSHPKSLSLDVRSHLSLAQVGAHPYFETITDGLQLSQSLQGECAIGNAQTLMLDQIAIGNLFRTVPLEQTLDFVSLVAYYIPNRTFYTLQTPLPTPPGLELITPPV